MRPRGVTLLAIGGELVLAVIAVAWASYRDLPLVVGRGGWVPNVLLGVGAAGVLAALNYWLLRAAPDLSPVRAVRALVDSTLRPLFAEVGPAEVLIIAVAAGVGEELLFRGVLQPEIGIVAASLVFGLLHMGGRGTLAFGLWVAAMGAALGALAIATDGLAASIVAHAVYDAAAIAYLRWGPA